MTVGSDTLTFTYDASGRPLSITLNGTTYYYVTNLQGDVTAILNTSGTAVVTYTYDAWGNPLTTSGDLATTLGTLNPLRYRGYVYDTETELYYLQSRYYDPEVGRFLNADVYASTGQGILGNNMFAYCNNNPVMGYDPNGMINWGGVLVGLVVGVAAAAAIAATIAIAAAASPLIAVAGTAVGLVASGMLTEAAVVTTGCAIMEEPAVYDVTIVVGNDRSGASLVYDFGENTSDYYLHTGVQSKKDVSVTFGSGIVFGYDELGDYGGEFLDVSASADYKGVSFGVDYCTSPSNFTNGYKDSHAFLLTSGISFSPDVSQKPVFSYDYYWPISK